MQFKIKVKGFKELDRVLADLPLAVSRRIISDALKKAAQPVLDSARAKVPVGSGTYRGRPRPHLRDSLDVQPTLSRRQRSKRTVQGDVELFIGPKVGIGQGGRHGHLVEFGTYKMAARPFLRPAWDENKNKVLDIFSKEIWENIKRAIK